MVDYFIDQVLVSGYTTSGWKWLGSTYVLQTPIKA
jgi:hypothetical protein